MNLAKNQEKIILTFLFFLWLLFFCFFYFSLTKPLYQDEGVFLAIGKGLAEGKLPYLNFWDHKTPGIYFLWQFLYLIFSNKIIFCKIFVWIINFFSAILIFGLSQKFKKGSGKYAVIIFLLPLVFFEGNYLTTGPFLAFFLVSSSWFLLCCKERTSSFFWSGFFMSLAVIFKQTACLSFLPVFVFVLFSKNYQKIVTFLLGFLSPFSFLWVYLETNHLKSQFYNQVIGSIKNYPPETVAKIISKWAETFGRVWWLWFGVFAFLLILKKRDKNHYLLLGLATVPIFGFVRHYPHYWLQVLPFLAVLSGIGFANLVNYLKQKNLSIVIYPFLFILGFSLWQNLLWFRWITENLNKPKEKEEKQIVKFINKLPQQNLLAENRYTGLYFLSSKKPATKYLYLTEVNEAEKARAKTLKLLRESKDIIVVWPKDQEFVYAKEVGAYLLENYQSIKEFPDQDLVIYVKN